MCKNCVIFTNFLSLFFGDLIYHILMSFISGMTLYLINVFYLIIIYIFSYVMELGFYREGTCVGLKLLFVVNVSFKWTTRALL